MDTEVANNSSNAWFFHSYYGYQEIVGKGNVYYAWAVRSGDVAVVPVPAAVWLFSTGLWGCWGWATDGGVDASVIWVI